MNTQFVTTKIVPIDEGEVAIQQHSLHDNLSFFSLIVGPLSHRIGRLQDQESYISFWVIWISEHVEILLPEGEEGEKNDIYVEDVRLRCIQ